MEEQIKEEKNENNLVNKGQNSNQQIAGAIILAGLLIAGAVMLKGSGRVTPSIINNNLGLENIQIKPVSIDDHIFGNPNAKVVVIEYSDLECPFCKTFHKTMQTVVERNNGEVAWVYRHFPLYQGSADRPPLHSKALKEAEATECAAELAGNDGFWKYTNKMFEITNSNNSLDETELPRIASAIGLDLGAFNTCLSSGKYKAIIDKSIAEGIGAGVQGTPKSFILKKGKVVNTIDGAEPLEMVTVKINAALK